MKDGHNVPLIIDNYGIRKLTPRECLLFQGFPKNYKIPEGMADSKIYKQAGNAVSVPVIERIAKKIVKALDKNSKEDLEEAEIGISEELEPETIITDQLPKAGIQITKGTEVILYSN